MKVASAPLAADGIASQELQNFANQIRWAPGLVKTAKGLDPLESFHVTGAYATSKFALYNKTLLIAAIIFLVVLGGIIMAVKRAFSTMTLAKTTGKNTKAAALATGIATAVVLYIVWLLSFLLTKFTMNSMDYQLRGMVMLLVGIVAIILSLALGH